MTWSNPSFLICDRVVVRPPSENNVFLNALSQIAPRLPAYQPHEATRRINTTNRTYHGPQSIKGTTTAASRQVISTAAQSLLRNGVNRVPCNAICVASGAATSCRNWSLSVCLRLSSWPTRPFVSEPPETEAIDVTLAFAFASTRYMSAPSTNSVARCPPPDKLT